MKRPILQLAAICSLAFTLNLSAAPHYVDVNSASPASPYSSWATAARTIQDAIDAANAGDQILVTNGIYQTGGRIISGSATNRVAVNKAVTVQSVNGPAVTIIKGYQMPGVTNGASAVRCVYLADSTALIGFTLTNGATGNLYDYGGGVWCDSTNTVISNCVFTANCAVYQGGGAFRGTLKNCTLTGNVALDSGGGAYQSLLINCLVTSNTALLPNGGGGGGAYGCTLSSCSLTGNLTLSSGGGAYVSVLYNCTLTGNSARVGGGASSSTLNNSILSVNTASAGGSGAAYGTLNNCTITANSTPGYGGGALGCTLNSCVLSSNSAPGFTGGGAVASTLNNCTVTGNLALVGGGVDTSKLTNCLLIANSAINDGGGANASTLSCCALNGNSATQGGGAEGGTLYNCTLTGNSAAVGGGADYSTLKGCIAYYNIGPSNANYSGSDLSYCCTTPLPDGGSGNITAEPQLASLSHLSAGSPCRGAGNAAFVPAFDIDGETWFNPPSIGCDEYHSGATLGPLSVAIQAAFTNAAPGFNLDFIAVISGITSASRWDFGDGTIVSNKPYASHGWVAAGDYPVVLRAYNDSNPGGVSATVTVHVVANPVQYVVQAGSNPQPPFTSWATAATNIQDAIEAAFVGGTILVSNGVYHSAGRVLFGFTNSVAISRPLTLRSVNGPAATLIDGAALMRCVYLAGGAVLSGFTLTNGTTPGAGGGVWCESAGSVVTNCVLAGNSSANQGGGAVNGTLNNCTLAGNTAATDGGGACSAMLVNCTLTANVATNAGGGADSCLLTNCVLTGNSCTLNGGGVQGSTLNHCTLAGNSAPYGGGALFSTLYDCVLTGNSSVAGGGANSCTLSRCLLTANMAANVGGGAIDCTLNSCALAGNSAVNSGGGAFVGTLNNCTVTGNRAGSGGGADTSTLNNCILFYNHAARNENYAQNYSSSIMLDHCCTTPLPPNNTNNIDADPQLVTVSHLSATSPCRGAGSAALAAGTDIDGEAWANPPSIGCDEIHAGAATGPLSVVIQVSRTNVAAGFMVDFAAWVTGNAAASRWDFGDGTVVTNRAYASHGWAAPGDHVVTLTVYNDSFPGGVTATVTVHVVAQPVHYVSPNCLTPLAPYSSWATAATNIQNAVDAASVPGALVLVTNGTYQTGGRVAFGLITNRLVLDKPVVVQSVNGPEATTIQGYPNNDGTAVRCACVMDGALLAGFTLTQGATRTDGDGNRDQNGGGVWCESSSAVVSNCVIAGNLAYNNGGGACGGSLYNCALNNNTANYSGGGASGSVLVNCSVSSNSAPYEGGGVDYCWLDHCTLSGNSGPDWWGNGGGGAYFSTLTNCTLSGNFGYFGGGASASVLAGCRLIGNTASYYGGGVTASTLSLCTVVSNNSAWDGGGADGSILDRCALTGNQAYYGGGAENSTLRSCVLTANSGRYNGGGADNCTLNNCNVTGNSAASYAGGVSGSTLNNSIVAYNASAAGSNYSSSTFNYCCTQPLPTNGLGNISADPQLADLSHISANSPCRGAGSFTYASGLDIDGEAWLNPPSIGCDEIHAGTATSTLSVDISASFTNVTPGLDLDFIAQISGQANSSRWEFGDGTVVSNQPYASHHWAAFGDYSVVLCAYNDANPGGISATVTVHVVTQPVFYVAISNATPSAPFTSWATAATNIQDAVDAVNAAGALVLVSNGVYATGARLVNNDVPHRVVINKPIVVRSLNGPATTFIEGHPWDAPVRCVYLAGGASLFDFTLTNGAAMPPWAETDSENRTCGGVWCDSTTALVSNCVIVACSAADSGGGAYGGTLINCTLTNNSAGGGGGAYSSSLINCLLAGNSAGSGGGAYSSTLSHCTLTGNSAGNGGGAALSILNNCLSSGNSASFGGAVDGCVASNSALVANAATDTGGGANASTLYNCTLTGNSATNFGGGVATCTNFNSVIFYNFAPVGPNWTNSSFNFCCTLPLPSGGSGNISAEPQLADTFHLSAGSPCRGAGLFSYASGTDLDGEAWLNPPSIGCDEFHAGAITGPLSIAIGTPYTNIAAGFTLSLQAVITGHAAACQWDFGDGTVVSNRPYTHHTWANPGDFTVALTAFNESFPSGVSTALTVHVQEPIHYVALNNPSPAAPYTSWANAATNIQDAVDATFVGGTIFVSNGVYQTGGRVGSSLSSNRVSVTRQLTLVSVNGPASTVIAGAQPSGPNAVRCVSLVRNCVLAGFTLTGGGTRTDGDGDLDQSGAGLWCDSTSVLVSNCVITGNSAGGGIGGVLRGNLCYCVISTNSSGGASSGVLDHCTVAGNSSTGAGGCTLNSCLIEGNSSYDAGGLYGCTLTNCTIKGNHAARYGGGSEASTMYNCLVIYNTAGYGGGGLYNDWAYNCTIVGNSAGGYGGGVLIASWLANCILYNNTAPNGPNYYSDYLNYCCTTPYYGGSPGNITNAPLFVDQAAGNFRLQTNSPCINAGQNASVSGNYDLDGRPRIVSGTVDIGAYEFQGPDFGYFIPWLQQYGLPTDGSADLADSDGDGHNNWQEWIAATIPTNPASVLRLSGPARDVSGLIVSWQSVTNRTYFIERSSNLGAHPAFLTLATNIAGQPITTSYTDTNAVGSGPFFYRVGIQSVGYQPQSTSSIISYAWLQQYGLPTDGSADFVDTDGDGMNNWQEWRTGTDPTDPLSFLKMTSAATTSDPPGIIVTWQSVSGKDYFLQRASDLAVQPAFSTIQSNIAGQAGTTSYFDTNAVGSGLYLYRAGVGN